MFLQLNYCSHVFMKNAHFSTMYHKGFCLTTVGTFLKQCSNNIVKQTITMQTFIKKKTLPSSTWFTTLQNYAGRVTIRGGVLGVVPFLWLCMNKIHIVLFIWICTYVVSINHIYLIKVTILWRESETNRQTVLLQRWKDEYILKIKLKCTNHDWLDW